MTSRQDPTLDRFKPTRLAASLAVVAICLGGCGMGGSDTTVVTGSGGTAATGVVTDGPIQGARVFLDLNDNQAHDEGEPISAPTGADGRFSLSLDGIDPARAAKAMLVTHVPDTARDADDAGLDLLAAGRRGFTLMTPASAYVKTDAQGEPAIVESVLSPLTTLVASEMTFNQQSLEQARERVSSVLPIGTKNPMRDFVADGDQSLRALARTVAISMGETGKAVSEAAKRDGIQSTRVQLAATLDTTRARLPAVLEKVDLSGTSATPVPAADVVADAATDPSTISLDASVDRASSGKERPKRHYVVVFKDDVENPSAEADRLVLGRGAKINFSFRNVIKGFAVTLPDAAADAFLEAMTHNPRVDRVEVDQRIELSGVSQASPSWGLDRADQRDLPLDSTYTYASTGRGVTAYVVDTGIRSTHVEFGTRVMPGFTAVDDANGSEDCNGHGTHVAGTIGGSSSGIAKDVTLVPVRVLDCAGSGTLGSVIAGLDWIAETAQRPAVVNMSLSGNASATLDAAVANTVAAGLTVVVAGGNSGADACGYSPAREPAALTVGATDAADARASYSNYGACVDLFAPGTGIRSAWHTGDTATNVISGTSMASPHVAGYVALVLETHPETSPTQLAKTISDGATRGEVTDAGAGSPDALLYVGAPADATAAPTQVTEPAAEPSAEPVRVASLAGIDGQGVRIRGWAAEISLTLRDLAGQPVAGAVARGGFSNGGSAVSCTTDAQGLCRIRSGHLGRRVTQTTFGLEGIEGAGIRFDERTLVAGTIAIRAP